MKNVLRIIIFFTIMIASFAFQQEKKLKYKTYYPSGNIKAITEMENGMKNGREELFFENGNLFMVQYFKNNMIVDSFFQYDKDAPDSILFKGYARPMARLVTIQASDGTIFGENDFKENLVPDGLMRTYFDNGRVFSTSIYKDGKKNGIKVIYYSNGNIRTIEHYKNDSVIPPFIEFDSLGNVLKNIPNN